MTQPMGEIAHIVHIHINSEGGIKEKETKKVTFQKTLEL